MTKEQIEDYLGNLKNQEKELRSAIESTTTTLYGVMGAIQAVTYLLESTETQTD